MLKDIKQNSVKTQIYIRRRKESTKINKTMYQIQIIKLLCSRLLDKLTFNNTARYNHNKNFYTDINTTDRTEKQQ